MADRRGVRVVRRRALARIATVTVAVAVVAGATGCSRTPDGPTADGDPDLVATDPPLPQSGGGDSAAQATLVVTSLTRGADGAAVDISMIVPGLVEDGGECAVQITQGAVVADARGDAVADVSSTSCGVLSVPGDELDPGSAVAVLSYAGPTGSTASLTTTVEIP